jgi:hypothetical protein
VDRVLLERWTNTLHDLIASTWKSPDISPVVVGRTMTTIDK